MDGDRGWDGLGLLTGRERCGLKRRWNRVARELLLLLREKGAESGVSCWWDHVSRKIVRGGQTRSVVMHRREEGCG